MFSNCSKDGIHINVYNYMLFFDNFYSYNNGVYGVYTQGTNSGFTNFQIERNGTAGIHIANANNRFTSGEVIWNGSTVSTEAAVYVSGARNIMTAVEAEDNYTSGFSTMAPTMNLSDVCPTPMAMQKKCGYIFPGGQWLFRRWNRRGIYRRQSNKLSEPSSR